MFGSQFLEFFAVKNIFLITVSEDVPDLDLLFFLDKVMNHGPEGSDTGSGRDKDNRLGERPACGKTAQRPLDLEFITRLEFPEVFGGKTAGNPFPAKIKSPFPIEG